MEQVIFIERFSARVGWYVLSELNFWSDGEEEFINEVLAEELCVQLASSEAQQFGCSHFS